MPLLSQEPLRPPSNDYVGAEICMICHEDISIAFEANPHLGKEMEVDGTAHTGCETCHGPGQNHFDTLDRAAIRTFGDGDPTAESGTCMGCHELQATHPDRIFDTHQASSVSCVSCHSIHSPAEPDRLLAAPTSDLCGTCHSVEAAGFLLPFAHPLRNEAMDCADCHAPHGDSGGFMLRTSHANEGACLDCHSDKRGPFAFEHMPAAVGGCATCHQPHGSANPRMLVRHEVRLLCLECHTNSISAVGATPPAFHDLRSARIRNCTLCHTKIHGSHLSRALLR